ncbi:polyamine ABC transporter ATP-binding protein [Enterobacter cloacae complex sp. 2DZ2F16B1]|nr:polyamine ABC transporter ATP-binding protein [Enterobacter cloacae complex sp. 2DZ2F16B1]
MERAKGNLEFKNVTFRYPGREVAALRNIDLNIPEGKTVALVGRSGSGKSTIASLITRFYDVDEGQILLDGHDLREYTLSSLRDQVALVSQNVHLFNDTVANNIAYARTEEYSREQIEEAARMAYAMDFINKMDNGLDTIIGENGVMLSGGQRQRVAIARALVNQPRVLLLGEPLGALDLKLREQMQLELKKLQQALGITFIFVTHDQGEALSMSDRVAVFNQGRIEQVDAPQDLYLRPRTAFVAGFVGTANVFSSELAQKLCAMTGAWSLRPEHIRLNAGGEVQIQGIVQAVQYMGAATRVELKLADGEKLLVSQANVDGQAALNAPPVGQQVLASWSRAAMVPLESGG